MKTIHNPSYPCSCTIDFKITSSVSEGAEDTKSVTGSIRYCKLHAGAAAFVTKVAGSQHENERDIASEDAIADRNEWIGEARELLK
jgi:hypothetical protein